MFIVEEDFNFKDLRCVIVFNDLYQRCGYVGVPKTNKFFGKDYNEIISKIKVYGGLSYNSNDEGDSYPVNSDLWWFGFACNNLMDGLDKEAAIEHFPELKEEIEKLAIRESENMKKVKTKDFVKDECISLANQFLREEN